MVRASEEYGDEESGVYDEEDDELREAGLNHEGSMHGADQSDDDNDNQIQGEEGDEDEEGLQMQIHPDLIAAAHKMGVDLDSEQIHEL